MSLRRSKRLKALPNTSSLPQTRSKSAELHAVRMQALSCPEIIENIVAHLKLRDQETCRLVCKVWNQEVSRMFRTSIAIVYPLRRPLTDLHEIVNAGQDLQLPSPYKEIKLKLSPIDAGRALEEHRSFDFPVTAIKFNAERISLSSIREHANAALALIKACAPLLTHLNVPSWGISSDVPSIPLDLLKLTSLTVLFKGYKNYDANDDVINNQCYFFAKLMASAPKLTELHIAADEFVSVLVHPPSSTYICKFLSIADITKIQVLSVYVTENNVLDVSREDFEMILISLKSVKIDQLKSLRIFRRDRDKALDFALMTKVITQFSDSLQKFSTNCDVFYPNSPFIFPACPRLVNLSLGFVTFSDLDLTNVLNLKKIKFAGSRYESVRHQLVPILSVESVSLGVAETRKIGVEISSKVLRKIVSDWFPNVRNWKVYDTEVHFLLIHRIQTQRFPKLYGKKRTKLTMRKTT